MKDWLRLIRVHQWSKNLILFVPLLTSHRFLEPGPFWAAVLGFLSFSLLASASYILNDFLDLAHDRGHPTKKNRPLASGALNHQSAKIVAGLFALAGFGLAFLLPKSFLACLGLYLGLSLAYSLKIKQIAIADVTLLAGLYTLRIIAGSTASQIQASVWLLVFGIFIFFSLALIKRFAELQFGENTTLKQAPGRDYKQDDWVLVASLGCSSGMLSVLVLMLYINSDEVKNLYKNPVTLLTLAPLFIFWIGRIWFLAFRKKVSEDPVFFALKDPTSYVLGLAVLFVLLIANL